MNPHHTITNVTLVFGENQLKLSGFGNLAGLLLRQPILHS